MRLLVTTAAWLLAGSLAGASAQTYPDRPIHMIVPLAAASAVDVASRIVADKMSADLGQPIIIDNQPGAAGIVGMRTGARAAPDGYTILGVNDSIMTMLPTMKDDVGYDPLADFAPITQMVTINFALIANPNFPASTLKQFLDLAREKPNSIDYGSGGLGSPQHIAMEMLMNMTGVKLNHVPYRGVTPAFNDLVGGHVPVMIVGLPLPNQFILDGRLKLFGMTAAQRSNVFPDSPTIAEAGVPGYDFTTWGALVAPARTPPAIVARLNDAALKAMRDPDVAKKLSDLGFTTIANKPDQFTASLKEGLARYDALAKSAHIHLE